MYKLTIASNDAHFTQEHILFDQSYIFEFEWIEREKYWVLHLYDGSENPIALGLKVALDWPILVDRIKDIHFWLRPKTPTAVLDFESFHKDFLLIAEKLDAPI